MGALNDSVYTASLILFQLTEIVGDQK